MDKTEKTLAAIDAGYWLAKDHGRWKVGHGHGGEIRIVSRDHRNKESARAAMITAWETRQ